MSRIMDGNKLNNDEDIISLNPQSFNEYFGQEKLKKNLKIFIEAAKKRKEVLDHTLLYGPPGLGKTTLAKIIAKEMNSKIKIVNGPSIEKPGDIASILSLIEPGDILFIDEIHRLPLVVEEILYSAMEEFKLITISKFGEDTSSIEITLPPFTLIGATTRPGALSTPLRSRFGITGKFDFYSNQELSLIIKRTAKALNTKIDDISSNLISSRCRGTPRIAIRLLKRIRDFANYENKFYIDKQITKKAFLDLKINELGLDEVDIKYLKTIADRFNGGPVGLEAIASSIGEESVNLEDIYEPFLIKIGMINRTPRGRILTEIAIKYLKINL